MICENCKIDYSAGLVQRMNSSAGSADLCGICALEWSNIIHNNNRTKFDGPMAEECRQKAVKFRESIGKS